MFLELPTQAPDRIIALMQQFREDPRDNKVDVGVGVYRNAEGNTPVMRAVRTAAQRVISTETTRAYTGLDGDPAFLDAMIGLRRVTGSDRFAFLARHRGMFSRLGTTSELVEKLRADYGIYMIGDSRMNIAGLNAQTVPILARAIAEAGI